MQANNILTAIDKPGTSAKSGKSNSSSSPEVSFNQMLNKEISSARKPEVEMARPAAKAPAPVKSNNSNNNNGNSSNTSVNANNNNNDGNTGNKLSNNDNTSAAPVSGKTEKTDDTGTDGASVKEEDSAKKEDDLSSQILALVGNLNAAPVPLDTSKSKATAIVDTGKNDSLPAIANIDAKTVSDLPDGNAVAALVQSVADTFDKTVAQAKTTVAASLPQGQVDTTAKPEVVATIAAQIISNTTATQSTDKLPEISLKTVASAAGTEKAMSGEITADSAVPLTPVAQDIRTGQPIAANTRATTDKVDTGAEKSSEVTLNELDLSQKVSDKPTDTRPATSTASDATKAFANDIAQAKDVLTERMTEPKLNPASKDSQQIIAPPAMAATNTVSSTQFNAAALAAEQIAPRVGSNGWDKAVGQKVVWMVGEGLQSAELTLNPPDLGPLQVVLKVSNDQASASFTSAQPEVREALEAALPRLKQMLSDAGVQLSGFSVNSQAAGQGQNFTQQQARTNAAPRAGNNTTDNSTISTVASAPARVQTNNGLVDTFA
ncbi:flagellar hook-length control protein FliK [Undibacterium sp. Di27W]|uniref:flagellar hook-length control protein FliK n=1 Tax=Undibacterium sp. Di27W TaxID=3413036 RepID=UPI003BEFD1CE